MRYLDGPLDRVLAEPADDDETLLRVRAWEVEDSPTDLCYRVVKDWLFWAMKVGW